MASFTERYHEYTKYNPTTIDKLGEVDWHHQPEPFKPLIDENLISLIPYLEFLKEESSKLNWQSLADQGDGLKISYLARLLYFTCGINSLYEAQDQTIYLRCNPSAGGLYPIECYVLYEMCFQGLAST